VSPPDFNEVIHRGAPEGRDPRDEAISELQSTIENYKKQLGEERFIWFVIATVLFDVIFLLQANNWAAPIVIGLLQLAGLLVVAEKCNVNPIMTLLDRIALITAGGRK
jgi:hypothetical protein